MNSDLNEKRSHGIGAVGKTLPTALAVHDLSCLGKCSLTMVLPTLAASGVQAIPIPTALLSTQTDGFEGYYFEELTEQMCKISKHLCEDIKLSVDAIYTGFLGSAGQIDKVCDIIDSFAPPLVLVDPVMGDHGKLYSTYTKDMVVKMRELCKKADVITPNITEACFLTGSDMLDVSGMTEKEAFEYASDICKKLLPLGVKKIAITGLHYSNNVATYGYDREKGEFIYSSGYVKCAYPGTGDMFASVLLGALLNGSTFEEASIKASNFTKKVIKYTSNFDTPVRNGVFFEPFLHELNK